MVKVLNSKTINGYKIILFSWKDKFYISIDNDCVLQNCINLELAEKRQNEFCELLESLPYSKYQKNKRNNKLNWELFKII